MRAGILHLVTKREVIKVEAVELANAVSGDEPVVQAALPHPVQPEEHHPCVEALVGPRQPQLALGRVSTSRWST